MSAQADVRAALETNEDVRMAVLKLAAALESSDLVLRGVNIGWYPPPRKRSLCGSLFGVDLFIEEMPPRWEA